MTLLQWFLVNLLIQVGLTVMYRAARDPVMEMLACFFLVAIPVLTFLFGLSLDSLDRKRAIWAKKVNAKLEELKNIKL